MTDETPSAPPPSAPQETPSDSPPAARSASRRVSRLDVTWRRHNLPAGLAVVALAAALMAASLFSRGADTHATHAPGDVSIPVDDDKARLATVRLDPNIATAAQLELLPEIGPTLAQKIVATREAAQQNGDARPFRHQADLNKVPGIGDKTIRRMAEYLDLPE